LIVTDGAAVIETLLDHVGIERALREVHRLTPAAALGEAARLRLRKRDEQFAESWLRSGSVMPGDAPRTSATNPRLHRGSL